jgi:hypothetical protein
MGMIEVLIGTSLCGLIVLGVLVAAVVLVVVLVGQRKRHTRPFAPPPPPQPPADVPPDRPVICGACEAENRRGSRFCDQCGAEL